MGLELDNDAVFDELEFRVFGEDIAGGLGVTLKVIAAVGSAEELLYQGAFKGVAADLQFDRTGLWQSAGKKQNRGSTRSPGCCHTTNLPLVGCLLQVQTLRRLWQGGETRAGSMSNPF
jgi:hypothetical protein